MFGSFEEPLISGSEVRDAGGIGGRDAGRTDIEGELGFEVDEEFEPFGGGSRNGAGHGISFLA